MSTSTSLIDKLSSVPAWVDYIQTLHAREIDLNLVRTQEVYERLVPGGMKAKIITVAGTNGKGSTAQLLNAVYLSAGYSVGKYTSPHLLKFNERIQINGKDVDDQQLLAAFQSVERARESTPLTYFEFCTLVAIELFSQAKLDLLILEVGLGGRLDAVNTLDCDLAIITSISIDHTAWLGTNVAQIAREKAGVVRANKPVVIGETRHDEALLMACAERGAKCFQLGKDFSFRLGLVAEADCQNTGSLNLEAQDTEKSQQWLWSDSTQELDQLPLPLRQAGVQLNNASCVIQAVMLLQDVLPVARSAIYAGLGSAQMIGRCQVVGVRPTVILDVAHNEDSVRVLSEFLTSLPVDGRLIAVCGMLQDKEIAISLEQIAPLVDHWQIGSIASERGSTAAHIAGIVKSLYPLKGEPLSNGIVGGKTADIRLSSAKVDGGIDQADIAQYDTILAAFLAAQLVANEEDCIVVFGSFYVVADILAHLSERDG